MVVYFSSAEINNARDIRFRKYGHVVGQPRKRYLDNGKYMNYVTIGYSENGDVKYKTMAQGLWKLAENKQQMKRFEPVTTKQDVKIWNKNLEQQAYYGKFTLDNIRNKAQQISNKLSHQGRRGQISVAVRSWDDKRGEWRSKW
jgi:hypothetical protein